MTFEIKALLLNSLNSQNDLFQVKLWQYLPRWEGPGVRQDRDHDPPAHQGRGDGGLQGQEELQGDKHKDKLLCAGIHVLILGKCL